MSWAGPEDIYLSTSLATYLDRSSTVVHSSLKSWALLCQVLYNDTTIDVEKLLVLLRDGRKLLGTLCSFDQFANVVLEGACERLIVGDLYSDIPLGLCNSRGECCSNWGIGLAKGRTSCAFDSCNRVSKPEIRMAQKVGREATDLKGTMRKRMEFLDLD